MKKKRFKILVAFGTRPEAIKLAPLIRRFKEEGIRTVVAVTSQHREMLDQVLELFHIKADYDLNVMVNDQSLFHVSSSVLTGMEHILKKEAPDFMIVQGDTTSTLMAALAGFYMGIPVGHLEAGLRTNDIQNPFPEEMNRRLASGLSTLHFTPTAEARENLLNEGFRRKDIYITGNTVIDALFMMLDKSRRSLMYNSGMRGIFVTVHRRESFGTPLKNVCIALRRLVKGFDDIEIIMPVHYNPNVRKVIFKELKGIPRIRLVKSMNYEETVNIMNDSYMVMTDSGGIQEEAPALGKPVLVLRERTERPEGVKSGAARLVGRDPHRIIKAASMLLNNKTVYKRMSRRVFPYGRGNASGRIVGIIKKRYIT